MAVHGKYAKANEAFLDGLLAWATQDFRVILIDTADYTVNLAVDQFLAAVPAAARIAVSLALTGKSSTDGVARADPFLLTGVAGDELEAVLIYQHTGVDATARLVCYMGNVRGLPHQPSGGFLEVSWPPEGVFAVG